MAFKILIAEDEEITLKHLVNTLGKEGHDVTGMQNGSDALQKIEQDSFDLLIADIKMPGLSGIELLERTRERSPETEVIIITGFGSIGSAIEAMKKGAAEYITKPFDLDELEARIRALRRRHQNAGADVALNPQEVGGLRFEPESGAIYHRSGILELTPRELALLKALMMKPGHAVSKERLFELVFPGETDVQYEAIEVVVYRLRKKLAGTGAALMTLRGLGYLLRAEP